MKTIHLKNIWVLLFLFTLNSNKSQELDPNIFRTWYLYELFPSDAFEAPLLTADISPEITPTLTIENNLNYTGFGSCNSFNGTFVSSDNYIYTSNNLTSGDNICENESQTEFEEIYFDTIQWDWYFQSIETVQNGYKLTLGTPIFGHIIFYSFPLATEDIEYEEEKIVIAPNPCKSELHLDTTLTIDKIHIFNHLGQLIQEISSPKKTLDVSLLAKGNYIITIYPNSKKVQQKFTKE